MKWCTLLLILRHHVLEALLGGLARLQQELQNLRVVLQGCEVQRRLELVGDRLEVGSLSNKKLNSKELFVVLRVGGVMQSCPTVGIDDVELSFAFEDLFKCILLLMLSRRREHHFVDGCLSDDRCFAVDVLATIDQILKIFLIGGLGRVGEGLEHIAGVLVLCNSERIPSVSC